MPAFCYRSFIATIEDAANLCCEKYNSRDFNAVDLNALRAVSSIFRQIRGLEEAVGQPLLYRHTRAVTLTEAGWCYYLFASLGPLPPWDRWREAMLTDRGRSS